MDGGGGRRAEDLAASSLWRADAFGSALGVNVSSTNDEMGGGMSERNTDVDIMAGGGRLGERYMGTLGTTGAEGTTTQVNMGWR